MRFASWCLPAALLAVLPAVTVAQNSECSSYGGRAANVCNAAVDGTRAFHPVAGVLISGGNPVLGSGGGLGGLGHFAVTARVNAVEVVLPDLAYDGTGTTVPAGDTVFAPAPVVEGAVGLYRGLRGGLLSVDALLSAQLLPTDQVDNLQVDSNATTLGSVALGLGYGVRLGVLQERGPLPGVAVSVMRRSIPRLQYGAVSEGDSYTYAVNLHATNLRLTAGKSFSVVDLAAGLGWDHYTGDATVQFTDPSLTLPGVQTVNFDLSSSRTLIFANAGFNLRFVRLLGEIGYQLGKDQRLSTTFEGFDTTAGKLFGGVGLRVGL